MNGGDSYGKYSNFLINLLMIYYAERIALNITQRFESNILLYKNITNIPFITGDTPIVCINEIYSNTEI